MTLKLTYQDVLALKPCYIDRVPSFGRRKYLTAAQALERGATIEDLLWVAAQIGRKDLCVRFALACAQRVAYLNPDPRVQAALHVTQAWLDTASDGRWGAVSDAVWATRAACAAGDASAAADAWATGDAGGDVARDAVGVAGAAARAAMAAARAAAWAAWAASAAARDAAGTARDAAGAAARAALGAVMAAAGDSCAARDAEYAEQRKIFLTIFA